jgi:hypothetical protein
MSMTTTRRHPWVSGGECLGGIGPLSARLTVISTVGPGPTCDESAALWACFW